MRDTGQCWLNNNSYSLTVYIVIVIHHASIIDTAWSSSTGETIVGNDAIHLIIKAVQRKRLWEKKVEREDGHRTNRSISKMDTVVSIEQTIYCIECCNQFIQSVMSGIKCMSSPCLVSLFLSVFRSTPHIDRFYVVSV